MTVRRLEPVVWHKGTLLTPQHLQQQDGYVEDTTRFQIDALNFRPWGFQALRIDREALAGGHLAIASASGIFSDGLLFDIPASDSAPPPKPLADAFAPDDTRLDFYLAIPPQRDLGVNVDTARNAADVRYRAAIEMVRDENTGVAEKPIQVARKNLRLVSEHDSREGLSALRVARVSRTVAGLYDLDATFVPPLVDITASDYLTTIARRLVEILTARSTALAGGRRQKNQSLADFTAADIPNFWLLYTVNTWLPVFRHIFESRKGHPEALFSAMTAMAGSLTTFSTEVQPRELPVYDHENLGDCFTHLDETLRFLLETAVPRNFVSLPLKQVQPSIYATSIDDERYLTANRMYLAIRAESRAAELIEKAPKLVKVCSANHVEHLVRQALPGVALTHVPIPPGAVPVKLDFEYFSLQQSGPAWESVVRSRNLAAYVPSELPKPELEWIILLPHAA
jgi:type VI secretion system protein ImpJ